MLCKNKDLLENLYQYVQRIVYLDTQYLTEAISGIFF